VGTPVSVASESDLTGFITPREMEEEDLKDESMAPFSTPGAHRDMVPIEPSLSSSFCSIY